jgi:hypothetical protein
MWEGTRDSTQGCKFDRMLLALLCAEVCMAALAGPHAHPGRRAALGSAAASLSLTLGSPPLAAQAAAPIEKGAPVFGTSESRTGLLDGIKSAFSEKTGAIRRSVHTLHALVTQHASRARPAPRWHREPAPHVCARITHARGAGEELALEYARSPADVSGVTSALPPAFAKARDVAIIFHGSGGPDRETVSHAGLQPSPGLAGLAGLADSWQACS